MVWSSHVCYEVEGLYQWVNISTVLAPINLLHSDLTMTCRTHIKIYACGLQPPSECCYVLPLQY